MGNNFIAIEYTMAWCGCVEALHSPHSNYNIQIFEELAVASIDLRREKSNSVDTHHKFGNLFNTYSTADRWFELNLKLMHSNRAGAFATTATDEGFKWKDNQK